METFSALLPICKGNPPATGVFLHKGRVSKTKALPCRAIIIFFNHMHSYIICIPLFLPLWIYAWKSFDFTGLFVGFFFQHIGTATKWPPLVGDILNCIFMNEKDTISIQISLKFIPKDPFNNKLGFIARFCSLHIHDVNHFYQVFQIWHN